MICAKVKREVSALEEEFKNRVRPRTVDASDDPQAIAQLGFESHGLVIRDGDGKVLFKQRDHTVKMGEVRQTIRKITGG